MQLNVLLAQLALMIVHEGGLKPHALIHSILIRMQSQQPKNGEIVRQTDRQTDRPTDRQTDILLTERKSIQTYLS